MKTHISNILAKLNLHRRMQIVTRYYSENEMADMMDRMQDEEE